MLLTEQKERRTEVGKKAKSSRRGNVGKATKGRRAVRVGVVAGTTFAGLAPAQLVSQPLPAFAQSPAADAYMTDVNSSHPFPAANAGVVEAVGMLGTCNYSPYTPGEVASTAEGWMNAGEDTVIEVSPQTYCDSLSVYEAGISYTIAAIKAGTGSTAFYNDWGGLMLDEEPDYGFTPSQLESLNSYLVNNSLDGGKLFIESSNYPGSAWSQADYESITWGPSSGLLQVADPQVYNSNHADYVNQGIADGNSSSTVVTCTGYSGAGGASPPWNSCSYAPGQINGSAWANDFIWEGTGSTWYNKWTPA